MNECPKCNKDTLYKKYRFNRETFQIEYVEKCYLCGYISEVHTVKKG